MNKKEENFDLRVLLKVLKKHIIPIAAAAVIAAGTGFLLAEFFIPKRYTSEALMYVESTSYRQAENEMGVNRTSDSQKLVDTCQILFTSDYVFGELSSRFGEKYTKEDLYRMVRVGSVNNTDVLRISVVSEDPQNSCDIANALIVLSVNEFHRIIKTGSTEIVSSPTLPDKHTYPSAVKHTVFGALIGIAGSYVFFLIRELNNKKLKPEDDLMEMYGLPVYAGIPDFQKAGSERRDEEQIRPEKYNAEKTAGAVKGKRR